MSNKTILVTGASKGVGLACIEVLLEEFKCNVVALSRSAPEELLALQKKYEGRLEIAKGDVANEADQKAAVQTALEKYNQLDGLVLNAGTLDPMARIGDVKLSEFKALFDVNFFSLVSIVQIALPYLRKTKGKVIFTSSGTATGNTSSWSAYNASKAALNSLCRTLGNEEPEITAVALRPGVVDTVMQQELIRKGKETMNEKDYLKFVNIHIGNQLIAPRVPGYILASLVINASKDLSGAFVNYSDDNMADYREK